MAMYGYVRVSTLEQNLDRQVAALKDFGVPVKNIYKEKQIGKDFERPIYKRLMRKTARRRYFGSEVLDRLGRNYTDLFSY